MAECGAAAVRKDCGGVFLGLQEFFLQLLGQLLKDQPVRLFTKHLHQILGQIAIQPDGVPAALIHIKAGEDLGVLLPQEQGCFRLAFEGEQRVAGVPGGVIVAAGQLFQPFGDRKRIRNRVKPPVCSS